LFAQCRGRLCTCYFFEATQQKVCQQTTPLTTKIARASVAYIIMSWHFMETNPTPCEQGDKTKQNKHHQPAAAAVTVSASS